MKSLLVGIGIAAVGPVLEAVVARVEATLDRHQTVLGHLVEERVDLRYAHRAKHVAVVLFIAEVCQEVLRVGYALILCHLLRRHRVVRLVLLGLSLGLLRQEQFRVGISGAWPELLIRWRVVSSLD